MDDFLIRKSPNHLAEILLGIASKNGNAGHFLMAMFAHSEQSNYQIFLKPVPNRSAGNFGGGLLWTHWPLNGRLDVRLYYGTRQGFLVSAFSIKFSYPI